ncbi:MAG: diguanylate cyclase [Candidatus Hydrogenedentota bacterium]|nr:MAG: diguanylate cyclase [Candidatus Hydrogenedentota bacterium]
MNGSWDILFFAAAGGIALLLPAIKNDRFSWRVALPAGGAAFLLSLGLHGVGALLPGIGFTTLVAFSGLIGAIIGEQILNRTLSLDDRKHAMEKEVHELRQEIQTIRKRERTLHQQIESHRELNELAGRFGLCESIEDVERTLLRSARTILRTDGVRLLRPDGSGPGSDLPEPLRFASRLTNPTRRSEGGYHMMAVPVRRLKSRDTAVLVVFRRREWNLNEFRLLFTICEIAHQALLAAELADEIKYAATHDALTNLYTRLEIERILGREFLLARRARRSIAVAIIDIDRFKRINDSFGHKVGDEVLERLGGLILDRLRLPAGRWGGEEIVIALPGGKARNLRDELRKFLRFVSSEIFLPDGSPVRFSGGVAEFPRDGDMIADVIAAADAALYRAKDSGRNRIVSFEEEA